MPAYITFVTRHRGRRRTHPIEDALGKFCRWLADRGVHALGSVTASHVRDFLASHTDKRRATIIKYAVELRGFFHFAYANGAMSKNLSAAAELSSNFRPSRPPDVVDPDTVERLLAGIARSNAIGKRDYAIVLLAARLGIRPSDIRRLRFEDVRWREARIVFVQSKSQRRLELPLSSEVEAALIDYIRHRPPCSARQIFVRHVPPIQPFAETSNFWSMMQRVIRASGVELQGRQRGLYLLRHSLAIQMLRKGVPFHTIKDVLGHASPDATRRYTQVDLEGLRSVALPEAEVRR